MIFKSEQVKYKSEKNQGQNVVANAIVDKIPAHRSLGNDLNAVGS